MGNQEGAATGASRADGGTPSGKRRVERRQVRQPASGSNGQRRARGRCDTGHCWMGEPPFETVGPCGLVRVRGIARRGRTGVVRGGGGAVEARTTSSIDCSAADGG